MERINAINRFGRKYEETLGGLLRWEKRLPRSTRRMIVAVVAGTLFVVAALVVPVPGPLSILLFFMGLTVLSWEFQFAERISNRLKSKAADIQASLQRHRKERRG